MINDEYQPVDAVNAGNRIGRVTDLEAPTMRFVPHRIPLRCRFAEDENLQAGLLKMQMY